MLLKNRLHNVLQFTDPSNFHIMSANGKLPNITSARSDVHELIYANFHIKLNTMLVTISFHS